MDRHETQRDRDNEEAIIKEFCSMFDLTFEKLHHEGRYKLDYALYGSLDSDKSRLIALAEVKDRSAQYNTVIMDLSKFREIHSYTTMGISCVFIVRVPSGISYCRIYEHQLLRYARSAKHHASKIRETDNGPVIHIPWSHFTPLSGGSK